MEGHMHSSLPTLQIHSEVCEIQVSVTDGINALLILTIIPLLDLLLVPMFQNCYATILKRLGVGATLAFLSILVLFLFEAFGSHDTGNVMCMFNASTREPGQLHISVYWILLPLVLVTLAEIFIFIPSNNVFTVLSTSLYRSMLIVLQVLSSSVHSHHITCAVSSLEYSSQSRASSHFFRCYSSTSSPGVLSTLTPLGPLLATRVPSGTTSSMSVCVCLVSSSTS